MLNQNSVLSGLTPQQLNAIVQMSQNDEATVIGTRIGEMHGRYDKDVFDVTGISKNDGEKSYDYVKRVLNQYKADTSSVTSLKEQLAAANAKVTELNGKLVSSDASAATRQLIKDTQAQVAQLQQQLKLKDSELAKEKSKFDKALKDVHIDYAFAEAAGGFKFKSDIPEAIRKVVLNAAKQEVLTKGKPDFVDDGTGNKKLVFRDTAGNILNNVKNNLNPYTFAELLQETSLKDIIDTGRQQTGTGTGAPAGGSGSSSLLDMTGIKTQVEADKAIEAYLLSNGLTRDSEEFSTKSMELRAENKVSELPIR